MMALTLSEAYVNAMTPEEAEIYEAIQCNVSEDQQEADSETEETEK